ncbi:protein prenylyltransferase, partial [Gloeophyllum trabeum ATCC 11539]
MDKALMSFRQLAEVLSLPLKSIEILPGHGNEWQPFFSAYGPFLYQDENLGVPQRMLYQSYLVAIREMAAIGNATAHSRQTVPTELVGITNVLLLANPAHQTALKRRKSLVQAGSLEPRKELDFLEALLSIRETSKQSMLWCYRRWLINQMQYRLRVQSTGSADMHEPGVGSADSMSLDGACPPLDVLRTELSIASRACDIYPRNYFAWLHRLLCMQALLPRDAEVADADAYKMFFILDEFTWARRWLETHVADYSAVHYLMSLSQHIRQIPHLGSSSAAEPILEAVESLSTHAQTLVQTYPDHETLWLYLR